MSARDEKLFNGPNQTRFRRTQSLCLILRKRRLDTGNLFLRKVLATTICELKENSFPSLREGDTRELLVLQTRVNSKIRITIVTIYIIVITKWSLLVVGSANKGQF